jgi:hypothetical protein
MKGSPSPRICATTARSMIYIHAAAQGFAYASADSPDDKEADAERLAAVVKALTGRKPKVRRMKNGEIVVECGREHLDGFKRYAELADAIAKWLEETSR